MPNGPEFDEKPELPPLPGDDDHNLEETIVLGWLAGVDSHNQLTTETFDAPSGGIFYRLRPLDQNIASLHSYMQAGWTGRDLVEGKAVIQQLLQKAGYHEKHVPLIHNMIVFAPRLYNNQESSTPDRLVTTAVNFLKTKNLMVAQGKIFLVNPPPLYALSLKTISALYPPIRDKVYVVNCQEGDIREVVDQLDQMVTGDHLDEWLAQNVPHHTLRFPKMNR